jgi:hypothetical protein
MLTPPRAESDVGPEPRTPSTPQTSARSLAAAPPASTSPVDLLRLRYTSHMSGGLPWRVVADFMDRAPFTLSPRTPMLRVQYYFVMLGLAQARCATSRASLV